MNEYFDLGETLDGGEYRLPIAALDYGTQILGPPRRGKSQLKRRMFRQLAQRVDAAQILIDPRGDLVDELKCDLYSLGLDDRLIVIDPSERRLKVGFNPVAPWPDDHELQAKIARDLLLRSAGFNDSAAATPRAARWTQNGTFGLIEGNLTMYDAPGLFSLHDNRVREALVGLLPDSYARSDFEWAMELHRRRDFRLLDEHLGASLNRFRSLVANPHIGLSLGTHRALSITEVIDRRMLVLVKLQLNVLDPQDRRLVGMQLINEVIRDVFRRSPSERVPTYLFIDEAGLFCTPEIGEILDRGAGYQLKLVLGHQNLSQFVGLDGDRRILDSVLGGTWLKIVFGGLAPRDADEIGALLFGHRLDPDRKQLVQLSPRQLQRVVHARSRTRGTSEAVTTSSGTSRTHAEGESEGSANSRAAGRSSGRAVSSLLGVGSATSNFTGGATTDSVANQGLEGLDAITHSTTLSSACSDVDSDCRAEGESETEGRSEAESYSESVSNFTMDASTVSEGVGSTWGSSESVSEGPMVVPTEVFQDPTYQIESLPTQLYRMVSRMVGRSPREVTLSYAREQPDVLRIGREEPPPIAIEEAGELDLPLMRSRDYYSSPEQIRQEIADRQRRLLNGQSRAEVLPDVLGSDESFRQNYKAGVPAIRANDHASKRSRTKGR